MERECFGDEEVAALLNNSFVAVKVDKEELPDVDSIFMTVSPLPFHLSSNLHAIGGAKPRGPWRLALDGKPQNR